jgi:sortase A
MAAGVILLVIYVGAGLHRGISSRLALSRFDKARAAVPDSKAPAGPQGAPVVLPGDEKVDVSLWSPKRVREYQASLQVKKDVPVAVLRLERLKIRVPVFEGTDELTLNRGVGWITGTARPGDVGNVGIAGHRDGFFRGLKDVSVGDAIELSTVGGTATYAVDQVQIVSPDNVSVLRQRRTPSLTLVTCYPFYFVGDAPQRFIVQAALKEQAGAR